MDFKQALLGLAKERSALNEFLSHQNEENINKNIIKIPTKLVVEKILDALSEKGLMPSPISKFDIVFLNDELMLKVVVSKSILSDINILFSVKIEDLSASKNGLKVVLKIHEQLDKNLSTAKKLAIKMFEKKGSLLTAILSKEKLPEDFEFSSDGKLFTFAYKANYFKNMGMLQLKFDSCDQNFIYLNFNIAEAPSKQKTAIKTGTISSMLNYSDRF